MNQIMNFNNPKDALEWATMLSKSRGFCPKEYWDLPYEILCAVQYGSELGITPIQSVQGIAVIKGKPSLYGDLLLAVCRASPYFEDIRETFDPKTITATCVVKRKGQSETIGTFDKAKAIQAGLWNQPTYKAYPERMLQMRARGFALRDCFPDVLKGLISSDEAEDYPPPKVVVDAAQELNGAIESQDAAHLEKDLLYKQMCDLIKSKEIFVDVVDTWLSRAGVQTLRDLPPELMQKIINYLEKED